jgi:hypothetical protein
MKIGAIKIGGFRAAHGPIALVTALVALAAANLHPIAFAQNPAPSNSASHVTHTPRNPDPSLDAGSVKSGAYRNLALGFACKIPPGWVLRTDEMNTLQGEDSNPAKKSEQSKPGRVLLAAFSRPPQARAEDINSSILIAAESTSQYPGLKDAAQYFGPLTEVAKAQGFEVDEDPYDFAVGAKTLVRGDFEKDVGTRVMHQSTLAMLARGYAVSFTFIGGTEDEVEELVGSLSFAVTAKPPK